MCFPYIFMIFVQSCCCCRKIGPSYIFDPPFQRMRARGIFPLAGSWLLAERGFVLVSIAAGGGNGPATLDVTTAQIAESVGIYLGVPLAAAVLTWLFLTRAKGAAWYYERFTPRIGKITLISLLFTVILLFASQSKSITHKAGAVAYTALPLLIYFIIMFVSTFKISQLCGSTYAQAVSLAFTAASNNFELALAVAVGTFGLQSDEALISVVGALIEIPTMLTLVKLAFYFRDHWTFKEATTQKASANGVMHDRAAHRGSVDL